VGIEGSTPALHFVTFAGLLTASPAETMNRLQTTLDLQRSVGVRLNSLERLLDSAKTLRHEPNATKLP
jgi:hypothetical protein